MLLDVATGYVSLSFRGYLETCDIADGARGGAVELRLCVASRKVAGSILDGVIEIFH